VKGYRLIDLSSGRLIIERNFQFEKSVSHVPQQPHVDTFVLPPIKHDEHAHADSYSYESSDSYLDDLDTNLVQSYANSVHADADAEIEQRPKWNKTTLQDA
jgi:hypothetical protein